MARFYGAVEGQAQTIATRRGTQDIRVSAQSWDGSIIVRLHYNDNGELVAEVGTSKGSSIYADKNHYIGNLEGFAQALENYKNDYKRFLIIGAKWWDKVNGNTYNSAVIIDNKTNKKYCVPYQYGYGESWKNEAIKYINENIVNYEIDYNNYNAVCVGYIKKADVKNHTYY